MTTIDLINAAKFYKGLEHQDRALKYLQTKIPADVVTEFAKRWRAAPTPTPIITATEAQQIFGRAATEAQLKDLNACLNRFAITTVPRLRHFMSQIAHESGGLQWFKEINQGWYIPSNFGLPAIAGSDGGYKYRGAGVIQLSMPDNYKAFASFMGDPKIYDQGCPYVAFTYPFTSAGFWWTNNGMNALCDSGASVEQVTRRVNNGIKGLEERQLYFNKAALIIH